MDRNTVKFHLSEAVGWTNSLYNWNSYNDRSGNGLLDQSIFSFISFFVRAIEAHFRMDEIEPTKVRLIGHRLKFHSNKLYYAMRASTNNNYITWKKN